ncbi:MAG: SUMF1/EgtB/PvdO family nonheme iron enzyme [Chloroflexota bacterium]|nr:SUMF1/EgtB/PvdO family nonheme iron enzyme [Chloroflexota bacterium]
MAGQAENVIRVLRGGAFNNNERNVRCAYRNRNNPNNRNKDIGFRVVVASHASHFESNQAISPEGSGQKCYSFTDDSRDRKKEK